MARKLLITIEHDPDVESPCDDFEWKVYSFNTRHASYKDPAPFFDRQRKPTRTMANKMRTGLAFKLGYYEHSLSTWALSGEEQQCLWDSVSLAGVLIYEGNSRDAWPRTLEERTKWARSFLKEYTEWCNGHCYYFHIETDEGVEVVEPGGGLIGMDSLFEAIAEHIEPGDTWTFLGDFASSAQYHEDVLKKAANAVPT